MLALSAHCNLCRIFGLDDIDTRRRLRAMVSLDHQAGLLMLLVVIELENLMKASENESFIYQISNFRATGIPHDDSIFEGTSQNG